MESLHPALKLYGALGVKLKPKLEEDFISLYNYKTKTRNINISALKFFSPVLLRLINLNFVTPNLRQTQRDTSKSDQSQLLMQSFYN